MRAYRAIVASMLTIIAVSTLLCLCILKTDGVGWAGGLPADDLDLSVGLVNASFSDFQHFDLDFQQPLRNLSRPITAVAFRASISKVLSIVPEGAMPDTLAIGIKLHDGEGRSCWLICSISCTTTPIQRRSMLLGDYFVCSSAAALSAVSEKAGKQVNATFELADFYPALLLAAQAGCISTNLTTLVVSSVYPFSHSVIYGEDAVVISAKLRSGEGFTVSSISIDDHEIPVIGCCGYSKPYGQTHEITVRGSAVARMWLWPYLIEKTFNDIHF